MHACRIVSLSDKEKAGNRALLSNKADRPWNTLIKYSHGERCSTLLTCTSSVSRRHQEHSLSSAKVGAVPIFILVAEQPSCSRKTSFCEKASLRSRGYKYLFPSFFFLTHPIVSTGRRPYPCYVYTSLLSQYSSESSSKNCKRNSLVVL